MKNIHNPHSINRELFRCIDQIGQLAIEASIRIDQLANFSEEPSDLIFCNELASSLELMQSQLDYYFPADQRQTDLEEWADALAVLNSGADFIEDQSIDIVSRFDAPELAKHLQTLSLAYVEAIPLLIAARIAHEGPDPVRRRKAAVSASSNVQKFATN